MKIIVDADACPVKNEIVEVAKKFNIPVIMIMDTSHIWEDNYAEIIIVEKKRDSADFAIVNRLSKGDIVVTQDYGVATMTLAKNSYAINQNGMEYSQDNIDRLLLERHISAKVRRSGGRGRLNNPKKRTKKNNDMFSKNFHKLCESICKNLRLNQ